MCAVRSPFPKPSGNSFWIDCVHASIQMEYFLSQSKLPAASGKTAKKLSNDLQNCYEKRWLFRRKEWRRKHRGPRRRDGLHRRNEEARSKRCAGRNTLTIDL